MSKVLSFLLVLMAACSGGVDSTTTHGTTTTAPENTTTSAETTTTAPRDCPGAPYELTSLPFGVGQGLLEPEDIEPDVWTSVGGTNTTFWGRSDSTVAIALIRGTLPAVDWPAEKGEILIDGTRGVVGPHLDGTWVGGWFEQPGERCDLYTIVFYPPVAPVEVEETIAGMDRVGG